MVFSVDFPNLDVSDRVREFNYYSEEQRDLCVFRFLFDGYSSRMMDREILHLDSKKSGGWQSWGIIRRYGLDKNHKGILAGMDVDQSIGFLESKGGDYSSVAASIRRCVGYDYSELESVVVSSESEGRKVSYFTTKYERSSKNRLEAIRIHGTVCMACGFDFEKTYGKRGCGFIEVHHVKPLSSRSEEVIVDPITDLVVVCSNCHRMIHRNHDDILSIDELRAIILHFSQSECRAKISGKKFRRGYPPVILTRCQVR